MTSSTETTQPEETKKLWGGRFQGSVDPIMEKFNESLSFDKRMWEEDLQGSKAYSTALEGQNVLTKEEMKSIHYGLDLIKDEWKSNKFIIHKGDEDIHTANERRLTELIGDVGGKLHTGRSRNDQVATDLRLYLKKICFQMRNSMEELMGAATQLAENNIKILMPGFTHLQPAQPIRFSHWIMSHVTALLRDAQRLEDLLVRVDVLPLGSGALAGNSFSIDRKLLAKELGFGAISMNSLDAVCDRDFVAEFMFWCSMTMLHLSQLSEDLIIYNTMKLVTLSDAYSTGSSLMPQKKNPDALELLRGKTGRVVGRLTGFLMTLKGLPRSYNKDLQEDKEALFDCIDTVKDCLKIATGIFSSTIPNEKAMRNLLVSEMLATDLAEYLVRKGVPFRETHHIAGKAVRLAEEKGKKLSELSLEELKNLNSFFQEDVKKVWEMETSVERKNVFGGTSESSVQEQILLIKNWISKKK